MLSDSWFRDLKFEFWGLDIKFVENYFLLENYTTSEGVVSYNVLYHQPLPINTRYQVRFDANNDSATAFKYPHRLYVKISFLHG